MAYPLPDKPSIAVLAFDNMSTEPEQDFFADGIAEDIITRLAMIHNLFVIARNSSFTYKGKQVKVQQVAEELGVRYVLEGSVRKSGDQVRITVQLIDAITGTHLWADRYDRELKDVFAVQDEITRKVVTELAVQLTEGENARLMQQGTVNWETWINYRQAVTQFRRFNKGANLKARELSEKAIALDANYSQAYSLLSWTYAWPVRFGLSSSPAEDLKKAEELANKASDLDSSNHDAQNVMGFIYMVKGQYDQAIVQGKRAVELAPNVTDTYALLALSQSFSGHYNDAIDSSIKAMRLAPFYPPWFLTTLYRSYFMAGSFEEAIETIRGFLDKSPDHQRAPVWLAAAYAALGQPEKARAEAEQILNKQPAFSLEAFSKAYPFKNRADFDRMLAYAREAGLPDKPPLPLPDKPSIAVLPFVNMSSDPEQEYFSDGISTEIINALVRWPAIVVIPRSSSFIYKGKTVDAKQVGREMGVRYVLEGSVRREENKVRVTVQLIDVTTLKHLFSERYEREMKDIFAIQDEITIKVLTAMRISLSGEGVLSLRGKGTKSIEAYLKVLQAEDVYQTVNRDTQVRARRLAEEAIALDPEYARAYAMVAGTIGNEVLLGVYKDRREALKRAMAIAEKAVQLDDSEEIAHRLLGFLALLNRDYGKAIAGAERAVELAPNSVMAQIMLGYALYSAGRTEEAIPILEKAASSSPIILPRALSHLGVALRKAGRLEEAVEVCTKLIQIKPNYIFPHLTLAAAFAEMGKMEEAQAEVREVMRIRPRYTVKLVPKSFPWKDQDELDRLADSLRKAGMK